MIREKQRKRNTGDPRFVYFHSDPSLSGTSMLRYLLLMTTVVLRCPEKVDPGILLL